MGPKCAPAGPIAFSPLYARLTREMAERPDLRSRMGDVPHQPGVYLTVSYTHLTLPTIYSV